jgi:trigger factor
MQTQVEELADNRVRLEVEVSRQDVQHAVDHAAADLAQSLRIPGFRKGRVPMPVLVARVGRERVFSEAVESHIGGWFRSAAVRTGIRPVEAPEYGYELPTSSDQTFKFTATVAVQEKPELPDWTQLEVPRIEPEVPAETVEQALDEVRASVAELVPTDGRGAADGDVLVIDFVSQDDARRDYVIELGAGRLLPAIEEALAGMRPEENKEVEYETPDGTANTVDITLKQLHERVLPPLDDELAQVASEFDTLAELQEDIEASLRSQLERESDEAFRAAVADALVTASNPEPSEQLVRTRAGALLRGLAESLDRRGLPLETYLALAGQTQEQLEQRLIAEAWQSIARELVLEAAADRLELEIPDDEVEALIREEAVAADEDAAEAIEVLRATGRFEQLRDDLRLRRALDRVASEVKRISTDLAAARDRLWTPEKEEQEKTPIDTKLWTPGSKESR